MAGADGVGCLRLRWRSEDLQIRVAAFGKFQRLFDVRENGEHPTLARPMIQLRTDQGGFPTRAADPDDTLEMAGRLVCECLRRRYILRRDPAGLIHQRRPPVL